MSSDPQPEDDPRPRRALILGGALLAAIVLYNANWWDGDDSPVVISMDRGDREEMRDEIRQAVHEARDDIREGIREGRDGAREAIEDARAGAGEDSAEDEPVEEAGVRVERTGEDGVRITIGGDDR